LLALCTEVVRFISPLSCCVKYYRVSKSVIRLCTTRINCLYERVRCIAAVAFTC